MSDTHPPLKLFTFSPGWGLPTIGPFGLKLEMCLRMLGVDYERVHENDTSKAPKRKSPWVEAPGLRLGDTELILAHLERTRGLALDTELDPRTRGRAHLLRRGLEEHFHQIFEYELFLCDEGFAITREQFGLPWPLSALIPQMIRRKMRGHLYERGLGRHDPEEIAAIGRAELDALAAALGDDPWLFGDEPCKADATAFGLLAVTIKSPLPTPVFRYARSKPTLVAYVDRALERFFADET